MPIITIIFLLFFCPLHLFAQQKLNTWKKHEFSICLSPLDLYVGKYNITITHSNGYFYHPMFAKNTLGQRATLEYAYFFGKKRTWFLASGLEFFKMKHKLGYTFEFKNFSNDTNLQDLVRTEQFTIYSVYSTLFVNIGKRIVLKERLFLNFQLGVKYIYALNSYNYAGREFVNLGNNEFAQYMFKRMNFGNAYSSYAGNAAWNVQTSLTWYFFKDTFLKIGVAYQETPFPQLETSFCFFSYDEQQPQATRFKTIGYDGYVSRLRFLNVFIGLGF